MERGRKLRATSRPPSELTASANAVNGAGSSEDEDYEAGALSQNKDVKWFTVVTCVLRQLLGACRSPAHQCLNVPPPDGSRKLTSQS